MKIWFEVSDSFARVSQFQMNTDPMTVGDYLMIDDLRLTVTKIIGRHRQRPRQSASRSGRTRTKKSAR